MQSGWSCFCFRFIVGEVHFERTNSNKMKVRIFEIGQPGHQTESKWQQVKNLRMAVVQGQEEITRTFRKDPSCFGFTSSSVKFVLKGLLRTSWKFDFSKSGNQVTILIQIIKKWTTSGWLQQIDSFNTFFFSLVLATFWVNPFYFLFFFNISDPKDIFLTLILNLEVSTWSLFQTQKVLKG